MNSLRILFRWMLLGWLALVVLMSIVVARSTDSAAPGNLLAFLFTRAEVPEPLPVLPPTPLPKPAPSPPAEEPQPVVSEWVALAQGKQAGKGLLGEPSVSVLESGAVEVRFACTGTPGNFMLHRPGNVPSLSVDLQGDWGKGISLDRKLRESCLSRVQVADHPNFLRISGVSRDGKRGLSVRVEHSPRVRAVRFVFSADQ